ncbi:uncharacterized protein ARMOST_06624 [Armillaria ostoyae]|uniref:Uncharacterized protein n=1 Tax=Armillaria ostoyae TaxID=47428 RepID=A0A284R3J3_ARMOS|nr:uncharacterized protein ARMOST_06624 [Armillaria ostoyae]
MKSDEEEDRREELIPHGIVFAKQDILNPYHQHICHAKTHSSFTENRVLLTESHVLFNDGRPLTFLDPRQSPLPEVMRNPWLPVRDQLRIARLSIRRFLALIYKQFLRQQWRGMVDTLSPQDDARHHFYWHNEAFCYLDPCYPFFLQGFQQRCVHYDTESCSPCQGIPTWNPLLTANEDEFLYHVASLFETEGRGELSNCLRYVRGAKPIMAKEMQAMFANGYVDTGVFYDDEGRQRALRGDEHDLHYYDEHDEEMY